MYHINAGSMVSTDVMVVVRGERIQKLASKGRFNGAHFSRDANAGSFDEAACKYAENAPNFLDAEKMLM